MKLEIHLSDLEAIGKDPQSFTQEELDTIFKGTQDKMGEVYLQTLSHFAYKTEHSREKEYRVSDLLEKLSRVKRLAVSPYVLSAISTEKVVLTPAHRLINLKAFVQSLTEVEAGFSNPKVYYKDKKGEVLPLDIERIEFKTPPTQLEMSIRE